MWVLLSRSMNAKIGINLVYTLTTYMHSTKMCLHSHTLSLALKYCKPSSILTRWQHDRCMSTVFGELGGAVKSGIIQVGARPFAVAVVAPAAGDDQAAASPHPQLSDTAF